MKYTIEGFNQRVALKMGLDLKDLVFLRWMVDFYNTGKMEIHNFEGKEYFWISYQYVLQELPILGIESKESLGRRIRGMSAVLEFQMFPGAGNQTYYRFRQEALMRLLSDTNEEGIDSKVEGVSDNDKGGPDLKVEGVSTQESEGIDSKVEANNIHLSNPSINDSKRMGARKRKESDNFVKPTVDEICTYCLERNNQIDPETFFDYYESVGWKVSKNKMKDWKAAVRNWERRDRVRKDGGGHSVSGRNGKHVNWEPIIADRLGKIATDTMIKSLLREMPENIWWMVDKFLRKRYPLAQGPAFSRIEIELRRELKV